MHVFEGIQGPRFWHITRYNHTKYESWTLPQLLVVWPDIRVRNRMVQPELWSVAGILLTEEHDKVNSSNPKGTVLFTSNCDKQASEDASYVRLQLDILQRLRRLLLSFVSKQ